MLITREQLEELTDCKQAVGQVAWLRSRAWRFELGVTGRPKVDTAEYERHMIGGLGDESREGPDTRWYGPKKNQAQKSA